jgi:hypothetical protein
MLLRNSVGKKDFPQGCERLHTDSRTQKLVRMREMCIMLLRAIQVSADVASKRQFKNPHTIYHRRITHCIFCNS